MLRINAHADCPPCVVASTRGRRCKVRRLKREASGLDPEAVHEVDSASGNIYQVDVLDETCTCPDYQTPNPYAM